MESLEGMEPLLLIGFVWFAGVVWFNYYTSVLSTQNMLCQERDRTLLLVIPLACAVGLFLVLGKLGDPYVRNDLFYLGFYWVWGMAWLAAAKWLLPLLGFSVRDDGLERRNTAATLAICGAFIGITASFAGGNIGEGPGWWIVLLCAVTSTGALLLGWFVLEFATQISETITIERNMAAGVRLAGLLIIMGLILGNAVSGNWIDMNDFVNSFVARAWYVVPLVIVSIGIEWLARPSVNQPRPSSVLYGFLPALGYCVFLVLAWMVVLKPIPPVTRSAPLMIPWGATHAVSAEVFRTIQMRTIFEHHKYDPQVGDTPMLMEYPLLLKRSAWRAIATYAEQLTRELLAAEAELCRQPALHKKLGVPAPIAREWRRGQPQHPADVRVMRFDFHMTTDGWRISECNCDTPGGYNEAIGFTELMHAQFPHTQLAGNPASELAEGITAVTGAGAHIALIYPTAFAEDQQILRFLQPYLEACGLITHITGPTHLRWQADGVWLDTPPGQQRIAYLYRYFPAEWLPNIGRTANWQALFTQFKLPATNPTTALLPQSKRFPLVWDDLETALPTWRALLPLTCDVRHVPHNQWRSWVLKPIYGRFGNDIAIPGVASEKLWTEVTKSARRHPEEWIAQQPFQPIPMPAPDGTFIYPCIGVYTVNGKACGLYGRSSPTPIVDSASRDIAILLIEDNEL